MKIRSKENLEQYFTEQEKIQTYLCALIKAHLKKLDKNASALPASKGYLESFLNLSTQQLEYAKEIKKSLEKVTDDNLREADFDTMYIYNQAIPLQQKHFDAMLDLNLLTTQKLLELLHISNDIFNFQEIKLGPHFDPNELQTNMERLQKLQSELEEKPEQLSDPTPTADEEKNLFPTLDDLGPEWLEEDEPYVPELPPTIEQTNRFFSSKDSRKTKRDSHDEQEDEPDTSAKRKPPK